MTASRSIPPPGNMQADFKDYGSFYTGRSYNRFVDENKIKPFAKEIVDRVLQHCDGGNPHYPRINHMLDLGCGNGHLFAEILKLLRKKREGKPNLEINAFGIDMIPEDNVKRGFKYIRSDLNNRSFDEISELANIPWESTALLCLCHTWPHFISTKSFNAFKRSRPGLALIGLYHSWDEALATLASSPNPYCEPRAIDARSNGVYVLRTEWLDRKKKTIHRGVWKNMSSKGKSHWIFPTVQEARTSRGYFGPHSQKKPNKRLNKIDPDQWIKWAQAVAGAGLLTGKANYVIADKFTCDTHWEQMVTRVLVAINPDADTVNGIYSRIVRNVVRKLFVNGSDNKSPYRGIRNLIRQFDGKQRLRNAVVSGAREAAVLEPFDANRAFARVCSLFERKDDTHIFKLRTILEEPERGQIRYRSAYALYRTMLDLVSSPEAFPLSQIPGYSYSDVDYLYEDLEMCHLSPTGNPEDVPKNGFFVLPVYYGSLPLFALILPPHPMFDRPFTGSDVYQSIFANLHSQIRLHLNNDFLKEEILRPLIESALPALQEAPSREKRTIEEAAGVLSKLLCGCDVNQADYVPDENESQGLLGRPWKSWVWTVPSLPLPKYAEVVEENKRLKQAFRDELRLALLCPEMRISYWFEMGEFFAPLNGTDDGPHEEWKASIHLPRLRNMKCPQCFGDKVVKDYFGERTTTHFLFLWLRSQVNVLMGNQEEEKDAAFQKLKSVFCKTLGNTGEAVRFSLNRLTYILEAASGSEVDTTNATTKAIYDNGWEMYYYDKDPSILIGEFVNAAKKVGSNGKVKIGLGVRASSISNRYIVNVSVEIVKKLHKPAGGTECDRFIKAFKMLRQYASINPPSAYDTTKWEINFGISEKYGFPTITKEVK